MLLLRKAIAFIKFLLDYGNNGLDYGLNEMKCFEFYIQCKLAAR